MDTTVVSLHLPQEIVEEILSRLGVKSLLRFRCVSKSWLSLIDSKPFIQTHLQYSTKNTDSDHHRLLIFTLSNSEYKQCSPRAFLAGSDLSPLGHQISAPCAFHASYCKGLICFYENARFHLLNPSTGVSKELPKVPGIDNCRESLRREIIGLGWDESSGAYKVFAGWNVVHADWYKSRVYSSKTNSWKTVENPQLSPVYCKEGKFVGGKLHWLSGNKKIITSFDLKSEVYGTIELPVDMMKSGCFGELGVVGSCLCLSAEYFNKPERPLDVWLMKESWKKLLTIHLAGELPHDQIGRYCASVIGAAANGEILIAYGSNLLVYCPRSGVIQQRKEIGCHYIARLYVESLVSPVREISSI